MNDRSDAKVFFEQSFTRGVFERTIIGQEHVHDAQLLDHRAAVLIAGHAGMANINAVWVDCNPQRAWLDKNDERKLMNMAYEHANKNQEWLERFQSMSSEATNQPFSDENSGAASLFVSTMKNYHAKFLESTVICLSPSTEAAMQEIVMSITEDMPEIVSQIEAIDQRENLNIESDMCKELSIILRRIQFTRGHFCKVVGRVLGYRHALQQGTAITARRLHQLEVEMRRGIIAWDNWLKLNIDKVVREIKDKIVTISMYNYDWVSDALSVLYLEQKELKDPGKSHDRHEDDDEDEGAGSKRRRADMDVTSIYEIPFKET